MSSISKISTLKCLEVQRSSTALPLRIDSLIIPLQTFAPMKTIGLLTLMVREEQTIELEVASTLIWTWYHLPTLCSNSKNIDLLCNKFSNVYL